MNEWAYDIETYPNLFTVTFLNMHSDETKVFYLCDKAQSDWDINELKHFMYEKENMFYGYNNMKFDDVIMRYIFANINRLNDAIDYETARYLLVSDIYRMADKVINQEEHFRGIAFNSIDLMKVARLFKGLKLVGANLMSKNIIEAPYFFNKYVSVEHIKDVLEYNYNDVLITRDLYHNQAEELELRRKITEQYKVNVLGSHRPGVADKLLTSMYANASKTSPYVFKTQTKFDSKIPFTEIISSKVVFKTPVLSKLYQAIIEDNASNNFNYVFCYDNTHYKLASGGLHSVNKNEFYQETDDHYVIDADVASFYPRIMINYNISPSHLDSKIFLDILKQMTEQRLTSKSLSSDPSLTDEERKKHKITAEALKIVINSVFGKLGDENGWLYDIRSMYRTTINGQLFLLMLIEKLTLEGIKVVYANTDGITCLVPKDKVEVYNDICNRWQMYLGFELEYTYYKRCYIRDVNNYVIVYYDKGKEKVKLKGDYAWEDYKKPDKGFYYPVVAKVAVDYLLANGKLDIRAKLKNEPDKTLFLFAPKIDRKFQVYQQFINSDKQSETVRTQRYNRFVVTHTGKGSKFFKKNYSSELSFVSGYELLQVNNLSTFNEETINYTFYYNKVIDLINMFPIIDESGKLLPAEGKTLSLF